MFGRETETKSRGSSPRNPHTNCDWALAFYIFLPLCPFLFFSPSPPPPSFVHPILSVHHGLHDWKHLCHHYGGRHRRCTVWFRHCVYVCHVSRVISSILVCSTDGMASLVSALNNTNVFSTRRALLMMARVAVRPLRTRVAFQRPCLAVPSLALSSPVSSLIGLVASGQFRLAR